MLTCVDAYRHAAARVIAHQQDISADVGSILRNPEAMPADAVVVIKAACLLTRTDVPTPDVTAVIVAKQFLESPVLIKRLAELEEVLLSYNTLAKLEVFVSEDAFSSPSLTPALLALAECVFALYDYHCAAISEGGPEREQLAWISPQRGSAQGTQEAQSISPLREVKAPGDVERSDFVTPTVQTLPLSRPLTSFREDVEVREDVERDVADVRDVREEREREEVRGDRDDAAREKVLNRCTIAARTVKRVALADFERLGSFFTCPTQFQPYCLALGALLYASALEMFKGRRLSLGSSWSALRTLFGKPPQLAQLLTECDAWETSAQAAAYLAKVGDTPLPISQLTQASPAAMALANWVVCFYDKWVEVGRPVKAQPPLAVWPKKVSRPTTPRTPRGTPSQSRSRSWVRNTHTGNTRSRSQSEAARVQSGPASRTTSRGRVSVSGASGVRTTSRSQRRVAKKPEPEIDMLEDKLLKTLVQVRMLTPRDLATLAAHQLTPSEGSRMVKSCVEGLAAITGLGGECPSDGTVDLWSVGVAALRSQPQEVLSAIRSLESSVLSDAVLSHVATLIPQMTSLSTQDRAVKVLRAWMQSMVDYQCHLKSDYAPHNALKTPRERKVPKTRESSSSEKTHSQAIAVIQCETLSPMPPKEIRPPVGDADVAAWLEAAGLERFIPTFAQHEVDMATLLLLEESDLQAMQVPVGPKRKLMSLIEEHKSQPAVLEA